MSCFRSGNFFLYKDSGLEIHKFPILMILIVECDFFIDICHFWIAIDIFFSYISKFVNVSGVILIIFVFKCFMWINKGIIFYLDALIKLFSSEYIRIWSFEHWI